MATRTNVETKIDRQLQILAAEVDAMREFLESWEDATRAERLSWESEWPAYAALILRLVERQGAEELTVQQGAALDAILAHVRALAPELERRTFAAPGIS